MKRWIALMLCFFTALLPMAAGRAETELSETEGLVSAVLMERETATRLWAKQADAEASVAGLTKLPAILTLVQAVDDGSLEESMTVRVSEYAAGVSGPTAFLDAGEQIAAKELVKSAVMISAGDAIMALGEAAFGAESIFIENINVTLRQLGLNKTLTDALGTGVRFTAWELATLGRAAKASGTFCRYCALYRDFVTHADGRETELVNANRLINNYAGCDGLMTGSSQEDGYAGIFSVNRNGTHFLAVVIGAENAVRRTAAAVALLDYGYANFRTETPVQNGETLVEDVPVRDGDCKTVDLVARQTQVIVLETARGRLSGTHNAPEYLTAPLDQASPVAEMTFCTENGETVCTVPLYPAQSVAAFGVRDILQMIFRRFTG